MVRSYLYLSNIATPFNPLIMTNKTKLQMSEYVGRIGDNVVLLTEKSRQYKERQIEAKVQEIAAKTAELRDMILLMDTV